MGKLISKGQLRTIEESADNEEKIKIVDDLKRNISLLNDQVISFDNLYHMLG